MIVGVAQLIKEVNDPDRYFTVLFERLEDREFDRLHMTTKRKPRFLSGWENFGNIRTAGCYKGFRLEFIYD